MVLIDTFAIMTKGTVAIATEATLIGIEVACEVFLDKRKQKWDKFIVV